MSALELAQVAVAGLLVLWVLLAVWVIQAVVRHGVRDRPPQDASGELARRRRAQERAARDAVRGPASGDVVHRGRW